MKPVCLPTTPAQSSVSTTPWLATSISLPPPNEISVVQFWLWSSYSASTLAPVTAIRQSRTVCTAQLRGVRRRRCNPCGEGWSNR